MPMIFRFESLQVWIFYGEKKWHNTNPYTYKLSMGSNIATHNKDKQEKFVSG